MSRYLVERINAQTNIEVLTGTRDHGAGRPRRQSRSCALAQPRSGEETTRPIRHLFLFIGADPNTDWLAQCDVALDGKGFVRTGAKLAANVTRWRPTAMASSPSATYAPGSVKRVAAAVGEGAQVVRRSRLSRAIRRACSAARAPAEGVMADECKHAADMRDVTPSALGCEECLKSVRNGCICGFAGPAAMSAAATARPTATPPSISTRPAIRSSKATIRRKAGDGAMSTRYSRPWRPRDAA